MRLIRSRTLVFLLLAGILTGISIQTGHAQVVHAYIDPGHGGVPPDPFADPGCVTPIEGYFEKDVNLSVGLEVKEWFDDYPGLFNVMYSRTADSGIARTTRAYQANGAGCSTNVGDVAYLVAHLFGDPPGPAPLPCP